MKTGFLNKEKNNDNTESHSLKSGTYLIILLAGTLLWGFSMGRWLAPLAAWVGPVLVMRYTRDHKVGRGYLFLLIASIMATCIGFLSIWLNGMPIQIVPFLAVGLGILWSLPYLADRLMKAKFKGFTSTFIYPLAATTIEFLFIHFNPLGTWGATGFTQYGNLPLMQLASVTGVIGITFLMGWFASVANWVYENWERSSEIRRGVATYAIVLAIVYLFGYLRLNLSPSSDTGETVRVAGLTTYSTTGFTSLESTLQKIPSLRDAYFEATENEAQTGAKVVVWAEISGLGLDSDEASLISRAQEVARQNEIYLAIPFYTAYPDTDRPSENKLLLFDPTGSIVIEHVKYGGNIVEGVLLGDGKLQTVDTPFGVLSAIICYDADFPAVVQQVGLNGTGLLLVPSKDWLEIDPVHAHMAVFRAIENGVSLVRQTDAGMSIVVDPYGRVLAQVDFFGSTDRTMVAQVPTKHVATIYTAFGRWSEWVFLIGFLYVVIRSLTLRKKIE